MPLNESAPQISLSELLRKLSELRGSDLHITTGSPRRFGSMDICVRSRATARSLLQTLSNWLTQC